MSINKHNNQLKEEDFTQSVYKAYVTLTSPTIRWYLK